MPSNPWSTPDGRRTRCPICRATVPTGSLRGHVGSVRCLASTMRAGWVLTAEQRALIAQGEAYGEAIRAMARAGAPGAPGEDGGRGGC